jgi:RNA polymerase sigma factor (sigma-70 family)
MDHERLVRLASGGDVRAFVELTKRFQHFAFGSALALIHDFQLAEDVVQESFLAAWSALPSLADPAAFPGWLRGIVRHHAFRVLRRRPETLPLSDADQVPNDEAAPDEQLGHRQQAAVALAAIAALPTSLREPATLFFVHECSHQDIATFLNLPVATVNNRLHAARTQLKERTLTMMTQTLQTHGLPDDFANRIGRLIEARGSVVDALFDPAAMPDILAELAVSDEANRRAVNVQVVQRRGAGIVRGIANSPIDALPRGSTVLNSGHHARTPFDAAQFEQMVRLLVGPTSGTAGLPKFLETGIKVIDVMCPLVAGGTLAIATDIGAGVMVMMEELVRRLSGGCDPLSIFVMMPPQSAERPDALEPEPGFSHAEQLRKEGYSEGTAGAVQTFFLRAEEGPWTTQRLAALAPADVVIRMSRERGQAKVYPTVDVLASRSRLLEMKVADADHVAIAERAREALASLWATPSEGKSCDGKSCDGKSCDGHVLFERALKVQNYFTQPFFCAEPYTNRSGASVSAAEAVRTCAAILDGQYDDVPVEAFYFSGGMAEIKGNTGRTLTFGPVTL